jgi:RNA-directed DNA polymerase
MWTGRRTEGTPQGGPLSPLLSNILLDDLDKELERRGHAFCRYADDCNIYVRSKQAGERGLTSLTQYLHGRLQTQGEPRPERRGPPVEPEISGVQHDVPPTAAA